MIGGGPAVLARPDGALLVDRRAGPHHCAPLSRLAQTPDMLRQLAAYGFDPYAVAAPGERVPTLAVRAWLDRMAACGPMVDGDGFLALNREREMVALVHPLSGGEGMMVPVDGIPTIAPGLPSQITPGCVPEMNNGHEAVPWMLAQLNTVRPKSQHLGDSMVALIEQGCTVPDILALLDRSDPALTDSLAVPISVMRADIAFHEARQAGGRLYYGTQLTTGDIAPTVADSWIVAGGADDALATAEVLLTGNPDATVAVVAERIDPAALHTARYAELCARYGTTESGDGRLVFHIGTAPGSVRFDEHAGLFTEGSVTAEGYAACLGRAAQLPVAVKKLTEWAEGHYGRITGCLLFDEYRQYLGYRLNFCAEDLIRQVDVTGAASWTLPAEAFPAELAHQLSALGLRAVPPESGSSPTDLLPVVEQAARLAGARRRQTVQVTETIPEGWLQTARYRPAPSAGAAPQWPHE